MALSENEKQKIAEEEKYREKVREKLKKEKIRKGCLGCSVLLGIITVFAIIVSVSTNNEENLNTSIQEQLEQKTQTPTPKLEQLSIEQIGHNESETTQFLEDISPEMTPEILEGNVENSTERSATGQANRSYINTIEKKVYIASSGRGKKYHRENCRTLRSGKKEIPLNEAIKKGYEPCKVCKP